MCNICHLFEKKACWETVHHFWTQLVLYALLFFPSRASREQSEKNVPLTVKISSKLIRIKLPLLQYKWTCGAKAMVMFASCLSSSPRAARSGCFLVLLQPKKKLISCWCHWPLTPVHPWSRDGCCPMFPREGRPLHLLQCRSTNAKFYCPAFLYSGTNSFSSLCLQLLATPLNTSPSGFRWHNYIRSG